MSIPDYGLPSPASWALRRQDLTESARPLAPAERGEVVCLSAYDPGERVDAWRAIVSKTFTSLSPEPLLSEAFGAELETIERAGISLSHIAGTPQRVLRGPREISRSKASVVFLNVQLEGESIVRHARGETVLKPGDCTLVDPRNPFVLEFAAPFRQLSLQLPDWWVNDQAELPMEAMAGLKVNAGQGSGRVMASAIEALITSPVDDIETTRDLASLFFEVTNRTLLAAARRESGFQPATEAQARTAIRLKRLIETDYHDEHLTPAAAAVALGCSVRNIHKICLTLGDSFGRLLLETRLVAAARLLAFNHGPTSVSDVAYECGFTDLSHFSRAFKQRFGVSPRLFRSARH